MNNIIPIETSNQIDLLNLNINQPLIISDADEVIFLFLKGFEKFLKSKNLYLDLAKARLTGNIKKISNHNAFLIFPLKNQLICIKGRLSEDLLNEIEIFTFTFTWSYTF